MSVTILAGEFGLTEDERAQLLPSGRQRTFDNRVAWAVSYLKQAGLLGSPAKGRFEISDEDCRCLSPRPSASLSAFSIRSLQSSANSDPERANATSKESWLHPPARPRTKPQRNSSSADNALRRSLELELLERVKGTTPEFFERVVLRLLVAMGYGGSLADAAEHLGRSVDDGVAERNQRRLDSASM